jgi:hypothetical protein
MKKKSLGQIAFELHAKAYNDFERRTWEATANQTWWNSYANVIAREVRKRDKEKQFKKFEEFEQSLKRIDNEQRGEMK